MSSMSSGSERSNEICPDDPHCDSRLSTSSFRSTGDECWPSGTVKIWLSEATRHLWDDAWHTTFATSITLRLCELCTKPKEDTLILFAIDVTSWDLQIDSVSQSSTSQSVNYPTQSMSKSRKKERHFRVLWFQTDCHTMNYSSIGSTPVVVRIDYRRSMNRWTSYYRSNILQKWPNKNGKIRKWSRIWPQDATSRYECYDAHNLTNTAA